MYSLCGYYEAYKKYSYNSLFLTDNNLTSITYEN